MYIVIEGVDKTGKTSLSNFLSKRLKLPIKKFSRPIGDPYCEYMEYLLLDDKPAILDRFYLGELVYGPVKRGKSELSDREWFNIEMTMMAHKPFLIYSSTDTKKIQDNFKKDGENYTQAKDVVPLKKAYKSAIDHSQLKWHHFDYQKDKNYKKILKQILPWHYDMMNKYLRLRDIRRTRMIGNPEAKVLIVGDICNTKLKENKDQRLVVPFAFGKSASYLYNALMLAGVDFKDIAVTNFTKYQNGNIGILTEVNNMPNLERIIYLGKHKKNSIPTMKKELELKHPSWAARFNYPIKKYSQELKQAIYGK